MHYPTLVLGPDPEKRCLAALHFRDADWCAIGGRFPDRSPKPGATSGKVFSHATRWCRASTCTCRRVRPAATSTDVLVCTGAREWHDSSHGQTASV